MLVLTGAVLLLGVMTLTADQIDAFNRLFRGPSTGDVSKRQDPRARDVENSQPQKLVEQRNQKELPPPSDGTTSPKKDKRKKGSRRHD
ncbi:hypothetical protein [Lentzea sp. NPDC092896]|uniref:hypothetical protein n=1 Tax=Lentzea sp. NPDC092896 TaxID=3364127 RepID=UPI00381CA25C